MNTTDSRETFNLLIVRLGRILTEHDVPVKAKTPEQRLGDSIERMLVQAEVEYIEKMPPAAPVATRLTWKKVDRIALEWALMSCHFEVMEDVYQPECLGFIKSALLTALEQSGYITDAEADSFERIESPWTCYKLWEEVARRSGVAESHIVEARAMAKSDFPKLYE